jgi:hypothetical protein
VTREIRLHVQRPTYARDPIGAREFTHFLIASVFDAQLRTRRRRRRFLRLVTASGSAKNSFLSSPFGFSATAVPEPAAGFAVTLRKRSA